MSETLSPFRGDGARDRLAWAMPLLPVAISGFLLSAMTWFRLQGGAAPDGTNFVQGLIVGAYQLFGFEPLFMVCVLVLTWSSIWFLTERVDRPLGRILRIGAFGVCLAILVNLRGDGSTPSGGGELGAFLATRMNSVLTPTFSILIVAAAAVAALLLATDFFFYSYFDGVARRGAALQRVDEGAVEVDAIRSLEELRLEVPDVAPRPAQAEPVEAAAVALPPEASVSAASAPVVADEPGSLERPAELDRMPDAELDAEPDEAMPPEEPAIDDEDVIRALSVGLEDELEASSFPVSDADDVDADADVDDGVAVDQDAVVQDAVDQDAVDRARDAEQDEVDAAVAPVVAMAEQQFELGFPSVDSVPGSSAAAGVVLPDDGVPPESIDAAHPDAVEPEPVYELERAAVRETAGQAGSGLGDGMIDEARSLVLEYRRASANFLKRRLRVSTEDAMALLHELARQGIVECEDGAAHGRVVVGL